MINRNESDNSDKRKRNKRSDPSYRDNKKDKGCGDLKAPSQRKSKNGIQEVDSSSANVTRKTLKERVRRIFLRFFCCCCPCEKETSYSTPSKIPEKVVTTPKPGSDGKDLEPSRTNLDDLEILKMIGRGSFGEVFLVRHLQLQEYEALKVIPKVPHSSDVQVRYITTEKCAWELASLHPHVNTLLRFFETPYSFNFISAYESGGSMDEFLSEFGPCLENVARWLSVQIISAIHFIHSRGIIHRDISSDNILLDEEGNAKLTDFGLSTFDNSPRDFCGTFPYLSPEILRGEAYDSSCDWWAFGILLYEMMIGETPFDLYLRTNRKKSLDIRTKIKVALKLTRTYPSGFSDDAKCAIEGFLQEEPEQRLGVVDMKHIGFFEGAEWPNTNS